VNKIFSLLLLFFLCLHSSLAQEEQQKDSLRTQSEDALKQDLKKKGVVVDDAVLKKLDEINPLAPSKAAFYSAVIPGLGQVYNKRYWKVPIVYGAIGAGIYLYDFNNDQYNRFRDAFKRRRAGFTDDEFVGISDTVLETQQERLQRSRDLALVITIALYALNIVDANVDAHLKQYNIDDNLSMDMHPYLDLNPVTNDPNYGIALVIKF